MKFSNKLSRFFQLSAKKALPILLNSIALLVIAGLGSCETGNNDNIVFTDTSCWIGPGLYNIPENKTGDTIRFGRALIANTSAYFGPAGTISHTTNGMNCQNCHLDAGTKPWGNNYGGVAANYPLFRARSGTIETIEKRVSDCFERSLNGTAPDTASAAMKAIVAYIKWVGEGVAKKTIPRGTGIQKIKKLDRAADAQKGRQVFISYCTNCHGINGAGLKDSSGNGNYQYPPLWGKNSYNMSAGLYRISNLAGFVKNNMPNTISYKNPVLSDEEAWDVAAYINSQEHPDKKWSTDWPDISKKPFDHPFGPYADSLTEKQHKYGPWKQ